MNNKILKIAAIGIFASLAYIAFTFLQIKIPTPGGTTSFHLGNTFVLLAALLIGGLPGGLAGAIGMGIGDLLDPIYVTYAPKTINKPATKKSTSKQKPVEYKTSRWYIDYEDKSGDLCHIWVEAYDKQDAIEAAKVEYWDIANIISVKKE